MYPEQPEKPDETGEFDPSRRARRGSPGREPESASRPPERPDHLAASRSGDEALGRALALVRHLRRHCDWDARQTAGSLLPYLLEEAHEVADAIRAGDPGSLAGELGDLLLNVAFQIVLAEQREDFGAREVVERLETKMVARHPHVYGDAEAAPDWERMKAAERLETEEGLEIRPRRRAATLEEAGGERGGGLDPFTDLPAGLEPLSRALRVQQRAAADGFDWAEVAGAVGKLREEIGELVELLEDRAAREAPDPEAAPESEGAPASGPATGPLEEEIGDLLFSAVNVARRAGCHPSASLAGATRKFERRYRALLRLADERDLDPADARLEELESLWAEVKARERRRTG